MTADSKRALAIFFSLIVILSGITEFMAIRYTAGTRTVMWSVGIAALLTLRIVKREPASLGWGWGRWRYEWMAFLIPAGYCIVAYTIIWTMGWGGFYNTHSVAGWRDMFGLKAWSDGAVLAYFLPVTAFFGLPGSLSTALGEEIGWRGFLVPELSKSMSFAKVALISGLVWAAWHLPLIVLGHYHNNSPAALPLAGQLVMFFTGVVSAAVIMAYLRLKSGSLWTGAIFHASHNLFVQTICNPLTIEYPHSAKYIDELGYVLPITILVVAVYFFIKGRRELA
jgi:membrane protease YdiL (CAAX protease family)